REYAPREIRAEMFLHARDDLALLAAIDSLCRLEQAEFEAVLLRRMDQRLNVLGEAGAAVTDARKKKMRADALVGAESAADVVDFGAYRLAQVGHLVDERDSQRQHRVTGVLGQLRRPRTHHQHRV